MADTKPKSSAWLLFVFGIAVLLNVSFWNHSKKILPRWDNVPAAPNEDFVGFAGLGDKEIAYRLVGYFLQNTGNVGGNYESLKSYDYATLENWFFASQTLDERSNYVPFLAAYYFSALDDEPEKSAHITHYLAEHGQLLYPQKWRWLAQAVYLARFKQNDMAEALRLANILASLNTDTAPWARQMPAFIQLKMGNKQAAYEIMVRMLASEQGKLSVIEANEMRRYICTRTLEPQEAAKNALCQDLP